MSRIRIRPDEHTSIADRAPGLLISLAVHVALFFLLMNTMRGCGGTPAGQSGEEFRSFGIVEKESSEVEQQAEPVDSVNTKQSDQVIDAQPLDDAPPAELHQPEATAPMIGAGPPPLPPNIGSSDIVFEQKSQIGGEAIAGPLGLGPGETAFIDIRDSGKRFVYVIDCSGSMIGNRIAFARAQLITSINLLEPSQQFQVVFYNTKTRSLSLRGGDRDKLYPATEQNTAAANRAIRKVPPDKGTQHVPAIKHAMRMQPEVIFFLTDGHDQPPSVAELAEIKRLNGGRSRIHCIEFGQGDLLNPVTWLRKLAKANGGRYKYFDVTKLERR